MANAEPLPANCTAAMPLPLTQSRWAVRDVVDSVVLRTLPSASSASMNATPPGRRLWNPVGVASMQARTAGTAKLALMAPNANSLKSEAIPSGQTLMLFWPESNPRMP